MVTAFTFLPPSSRPRGIFPLLDSPFLLFALKRQLERLQSSMPTDAFQQFAALARNIQLARDASVRVVGSSGTVRVYVRVPQDVATRYGTARVIPISDGVLKEAGKEASKAGGKAAEAMKDPFGVIIKEVQDKLPSVEQVVGVEDMGAKAAKNMIERAKVGF
jgi:hypothetical protein